jgi:hypothetical protein
MTFKKTFLSLLALITMGGSAMADDKPVITVDDIEALPGETVSFYVNLSGGKDNTYKGMVLYAYSTQAGFTLTDVTAASEWGAAGIVGVINPTEGNPSISVNSAKALPSGTIDDLLEVKLEVDNSVGLGNYDVTLKKTALRYFVGDDTREDIADDVTFTVKVVERHTVILDEMATIAPKAATGVDVTVKRTIKANEWSTICLPFAMTEAQVNTAFGNDVLLKDFDGIESTYEGDDVVNIQVKFNTATAIEANHPYVIKVSSDKSEFTVEDVNISPEDEPSVDKDEWISGSGTKKDPYVYHYNSFVGTYVAETAVPNDCLFLSGNKFWYSNGSTKMKGFRAYFDFYDVLSEVENASARIDFNFDDTTGIKEVHGNASVEGTYDLQGRKVEEPTNKGLYIVNGKKVVKK